jgi:hypothetical protein
MTMMVDWEVLADAMEEVAEWEAYEADLAEGDPWAE